jgi:outer membrane protein assembly factor BamB
MNKKAQYIFLALYMMLMLSCEGDILPSENELNSNNNVGSAYPTSPYYLWKKSYNQSNLGYPAISTDRILAFSWDGYAYCLKRKDGSLLWKTKTNASFD